MANLRVINLLSLTLLIFFTMVLVYIEVSAWQWYIHKFFNFAIKSSKAYDLPSENILIPAAIEVSANFINSEASNPISTHERFREIGPCAIDYCHPQCGCPSEICGC